MKEEVSYESFKKDGDNALVPVKISFFEDNFEEAASFYYSETNKLSFANQVLMTQLRAVLEEKRILAEEINKLEKGERNLEEEKKKRHRRCASEIERKYVCPVKKCQKSYGTEGSMSQHMKLKHPTIVYMPEMCNTQFSKVKKEEPQQL